MADFREAIREAVRQEAPERKPGRPDASRIARRIRDVIIWPERAFEVRRESAVEEVKREARDGESE